MDVDELQLVKRVVLYDDQMAFKAIVRLHQSPLRLFLRRMLANEQLADELAQEVFWIGYRKLDQLEGAKLRPWLYTIAYRLALKEIKKSARFTIKENFDDERSEISEDPDLQFDLSKALADLDEKDRALLLDWASNGMSHQDIAEAYSMPLGSVKSIIFRARKKLKQTLFDLGYGG